MAVVLHGRSIVDQGGMTALCVSIAGLQANFQIFAMQSYPANAALI